MSATARLAEFTVKTSLEECPPEAVACVRLAALDTLGVMKVGPAVAPILDAYRKRLAGR